MDASECELLITSTGALAVKSHQPRVLKRLGGGKSCSWSIWTRDAIRRTKSRTTGGASSLKVTDCPSLTCRSIPAGDRAGPRSEANRLLSIKLSLN